MKDFSKLKLVLVLTVLAALFAVSAQPAASASLSSTSGDVTAGDVSIWTKSVLPLRADTSNAAVRVPNQATYVNNGSGSGDVPLNKDWLAVYDPGTQVTLKFENRTGVSTSQFASKDTELIIGHLEENVDTLPAIPGLTTLDRKSVV